MTDSGDPTSDSDDEDSGMGASAREVQPSRSAGAVWFRPRPTPVVLLLFALLCLGIWARLHAFGFPRTLQFDEHHFVENARNYLHRQADWNDHPPTGKLLLAASIRLWGDNSVAWRLPSLIFGGLTILFGALAAARLFRDRSAGLFAAAFLAADGFLIAYSRTALLDGFLATAAAATLLLCSFGLSVLTALLAGGLLGFAFSIKFSGGAVALPLLLAWSLQCRWTARRLLVAALLPLTGGVTLFGLYRYGLELAHQPHQVLDIANDIGRLVTHHAALTDMKNPLTSGWVTWAIPTRAMLLGFFEKGGSIRALSMLGNLALWWPAVAVGTLCAWTVLSSGTTAVVAERDDFTALSGSKQALMKSFVLTQGRTVLVLLATACAFLLPWMLTHRDSYLYHFLPSYTALIVLLAGFVAWMDRRLPGSALMFTVVVLLVAAYYAPIWSYLPIDQQAFRHRLFLPSWR